MEGRDLERRVSLGRLMDFYGPLMTEHRREMARLYCEEDLSLGEIAQEAGISRQAVHDLLSRAAHQLFELEEKLGMAERFTRMQTGLAECEQALRENRYDDALAVIASLRALDQEDSNGL